ncbi:Ankyrin repeat family protein [Prunus dulcis]|uniref:Ankyrin repeat family protein n=1 Tax=Prunus dulcis TaxID=3755 RepID=A0A4Y1RCE6_PRUDU|nr:Ankyrin repeat family protein [Prunus dulcis]
MFEEEHWSPGDQQSYSIGYDERHRLHRRRSCIAPCPRHWPRRADPLPDAMKSWRVMPDDQGSHEESLTYVNRLFAERYKQWKSDLHHHFQAFDDPQVALQEGCPKELEGWEGSWEWLCAHFQAPEFAEEEELSHHSGSRPFSYRVDARRREGSSSQRSTSLVTFMFDPWNELADDDGGEEQLVLQESASQLPPEIDRVCGSSTGCWISDLNETLDQTLGRRPGHIIEGWGNARRRELETSFIGAVKQSGDYFDSTGGELQGQMSVILQSSHREAFQSRSFMRRPLPSVHRACPDHAPVDAQTSEPHTGTTS